MSEVSIIELIVYGLIGYSGVISLILTAFRNDKDIESTNFLKAIWLIAPIVAMFMLSSAGTVIDFGSTTVTTYFPNGTEIHHDTIENEISLINPVWVSLHGMFFVMLILYFIWNMLRVFTNRKQ